MRRSDSRPSGKVLKGLPAFTTIKGGAYFFLPGLNALRYLATLATEAGNTEFNALLWMPPNGQRAGDILLVDSTNFMTLFGGTDSLKTF
ncbi:MAG TPA: hypothetical protein VEF72_29650 [Mycobacterium sp.]|nr:hypothetical protein [Mycobacterium sp.]